MKTKLNLTGRMKINKVPARTNLFNETKVKLSGTPGSSSSGGGVSTKIFDFTFDATFE